MPMLNEAKQPSDPADIDLPVRRSAFQSLRLPRAFLVIVVPATVMVGIGLGWLTSSLDGGNRLVVGNTGKTLSMVIRDERALVVIGGGTSTTDLADLIDRSTLPWRRHVSVLVIGTNGDQLMGAMSLIGRDGVDTVVVAGIPESEPIWDLLDRQAAQHHVTVKYVNRPTRVRVTNNLTIDAVPVEPATSKGASGALVCLRVASLRFTWVTGLPKEAKMTPGDLVYDLRSNVLVNADGAALPDGTGGAELSVSPAAARAAGVRHVPSRFTAELDSGAQLPIRFSDNELRIPHNHVVDSEHDGTH